MRLLQISLGTYHITQQTSQLNIWRNHHLRFNSASMSGIILLFLLPTQEATVPPAAREGGGNLRARQGQQTCLCFLLLVVCSFLVHSSSSTCFISSSIRSLSIADLLSANLREASAAAWAAIAVAASLSFSSSWLFAVSRADFVLISSP